MTVYSIALLLFFSAVFHFARLRYAEYSPEMTYTDEWAITGKNWFTDFADGTGKNMDGHLSIFLKRMFEAGDPVVVRANAELFQYPFLYTVEPEQMVLSEEEAATIREWLGRGGFWMLDDFHGCPEKDHVMRQMKRVLGQDQLFKPIGVHHELFHTVFDLDAIHSVPVISIAHYRAHITTQDWSRSWETPSICNKPEILMWDKDNGTIILFWNTDTGDGLEHADDPEYPVNMSRYAFQVFANTIVYAMTH